MRISVLGPLAVTEGGRAIAVGGPRQRAVLAFLALHANQVIAGERLVDDLWGVPAPAGAQNALQAAVSRLRKVLPAGRLVTTSNGYLLRLTPGELDLAEFEDALARGTRALAAGAADDAAAVLRAALGLWRGPALADFRFEPFAQAEIARLEEARLACLQARLDADLDLGGGGELVAELTRLVAEHPLREHLTGQLMVALYRAGRQAEALEAFRGTRQLLAEELGIDPSAELSRLQAAVLRQEPWLFGTGGPDGGAAGPVVTSSRRPVTVVCIAPAVPGGRAGAIDPEMLARVVARVHALAGPVLERHGGRLLPLPGPQVHGVFGVVALHEDDARRGAAAALDCRDAVLAGLGPAFTCRIGVATGEALVPAADPLAFTGEALGHAQALADAAASGQVLVGEQTYRLAAAALDAVPVGSTGDRPAYALRGVLLGARSLPVRLESPLLGRAGELARLVEACERSRAARSTVFVTLTGDAGLGKTRLVHELGRRLGDDARLVTGRCLPYGEGVTFWPLRELVEQITGATVGGDGDGIAAAVERSLRGEPDSAVVADRLARAFGSGRPGTSDTAEIFWATRRLLEAAARRQPLVVVLEDLHWAEPTFLDLLGSVAVQPPGAPVTVLCLTRPDLLSEHPDWLAAAPGHAVVTLVALPDRAAAAIADELAGPVTLLPAMRAELVRAAGGNPLYLEQLVAAIVEQPRSWTATGDTPLPPTIQALLASRLDRLGPAESEVLAAASVVGKDFGTDAVAALLPRQIGDRLTWHLRTLGDRALVQAAASPAQGSFRHILVQQAAYRAMPKTARATLHERLADWAEGSTARGGTRRVELLGHHLARATSYYRELGEPERADPLGRRATRYLHQAADASLAIGDAAAAVRAYQRTLALLPAGDAGRPTVLVGLGTALFETGRLAEARAALDDALAQARALGSAGQEAHARVQSLLLDVHLDPDGALDRVERAVPVARAAFQAAADASGVCRSWLLEAAVHWHRARSASAEAAWQRAADAARAAGDTRHLTRSLRWLASAALWGPTPAGEGIARCHAYLDEIGSTPTGRAVVHLHLAGLYAMTGDLPAARDLRARGTAVLREVGAVLPMVLAEPAALIALLVEDHAAAERHLRGAFDTLRAMGEQMDASTCAALLARVIAVQGCDETGVPLPGFDRWDEAAGYVEFGRASAGGQDLSARIVGDGAMARVLVARGRVGEAVELARGAVRLAATTDLVNQHADALADLAHVLRAAGDEADAVAQARRARHLYLGKENRLAARQCDRFLAARPVAAPD